MGINFQPPTTNRNGEVNNVVGVNALKKANTILWKEVANGNCMNYPIDILFNQSNALTQFNNTCY